jgi:hypothetical protein
LSLLGAAAPLLLQQQQAQQQQQQQQQQAQLGLPGSEAITLQVQLLHKQLLAINEHLYSVTAMSGTQISASPLADGLVSVSIRGAQPQVDHARQMLALLLSCVA